jgi:hypothetical protein
VVAFGNGNMQKMTTLGCSRSQNTEKVEMAVGEWLGMQEPEIYCDEILKLLPSVRMGQMNQCARCLC